MILTTTKLRNDNISYNDPFNFLSSTGEVCKVRPRLIRQQQHQHQQQQPPTQPSDGARQTDPPFERHLPPLPYHPPASLPSPALTLHPQAPPPRRSLPSQPQRPTQRLTNVTRTRTAQHHVIRDRTSGRQGW